MAGRTRQVVWTENARSDLDEVLDYIAEDSALAAGRFLHVVLDAAESLTSLADRFSSSP